MRQRQQARAPVAIHAQGDAITVEAARQVVDHGVPQVFQSRLFGRHAQHIQRGAGALQAACALLGGAAPKQTLEPAGAPVQLAQHGLQRVVGPLGKVQHHRTVQASINLHRIRHHHQRAGLSAQDQAAALTQALLRPRRQIGDVGLVGRPHPGRDKGAAALLEQQQRGAHVLELGALDREPTAAKVGRIFSRDEGAPQRVRCRRGSGVAGCGGCR